MFRGDPEMGMSKIKPTKNETTINNLPVNHEHYGPGIIHQCLQ